MDEVLTSLKEFRSAGRVRAVIDRIRDIVTRTWVIMEICGGQTHSFMEYGLSEMLPEEIELVHGPGCPVCVTSLELVDKALAIASQPDVIFTSYGDMLRVPGSNGDLFSVRAAGGQVKAVYSALDAVKIARENPDRQVVFFAIGFETTAPANAASIIQAKALGLKNFSILVSQVCVPPAMHAILRSPTNRVQGFLAAGHVCAVMGYHEYLPISEQYRVPMVVTGFEPLDLAIGLLETVQLLETGKVEVLNAYPRVVTREGNLAAQKILSDVFEPCDRNWRGIGMIPMSGLTLKPAWDAFNAEKRFQVSQIQTRESQDCIAGYILQGIHKPTDCPAFGTRCTPESPLGATMVSSEGACSIYWRFKRHPQAAQE
ncbi:MAG: hydrogenase formation protein HypD [Anaerolineaceae bacterium]